MKLRLRTSSGKYLSCDGASDTTPLNAGKSNKGETEEFSLVINNQVISSDHRGTLRISSGDRGTLRTTRNLTTFHMSQNYRQDAYVTTIDSRGRHQNRLFVQTHFFGEKGDDFIITRLNRDGEVLLDGDEIALKFVETDKPGFLSSDSSGLLRIINKDNPGSQEIFVVETMSELKLFWSDQRADNFSTATPLGELQAIQAGYAFVRTQGLVYMNSMPGCNPLFLFWNNQNGDNLITATKEGEKEANDNGYVKVRIEGWIKSKPEPGTIPLRMYWKGAERKDSFTTTSIKEEQDAANAGYEFVRDEGYIIPPLSVIIPSVSILTPGTIQPNFDSIEGVGNQNIDNSDINREGLINININSPRRRRGANKKALILSGGGAKGCFEVGAVKQLWSKGWRPDIICGVSVGALNAAKLAERKDTSPAELEEIWRELRPEKRGGRAVYSKDYFVNLLSTWIPNMLSDGIDDLIGAKDIFEWLKYAASHLHAIHSMHPLRHLIHRNLNIGAIRTGGTQLRIGITDLRTGQYFSVTEPFEAGALGLNMCGRIELEPDHRMGETWLTRPIFGADAYAMSIEDAVYSSSVLPVFMDPKIVNLRTARPISYGNEKIVMLKVPGTAFNATYPLPAIERIMQFTRGEQPFGSQVFKDLKNSFAPPYNLDQILKESDDVFKGDSRQSQYPLFDGGLRDTMAIRTAIRLGAREIVVITGDRLQAAHWNFKNPGLINSEEGKVDFSALPVAQYLFGLLNVWFNESARNDVMVSIAQNEFLGWLYRCFSLMDNDKRRQIVAEFNEYWAKKGPILERTLGGSSWIGGDLAKNYGTPFQDEGCSINYIAPQKDLVDALGFDRWDEIEEGIQMGYEAANSPVELSFPVPDHSIR
ncbi:MAG TPA: patatin-like phospholipase family protein [Nitrosomonas sp.]|nr:patatin-like phospholipase family protein [Nitrosomonas sp.]HMW68544.1 patatin-like phospholipase family protein [Nitrosomonas sp.]HMY60772.1 patatin-like phospholipase family protein [Nitrosomonas sp.]HMY89291.1 patatin-like phospholipase family protein [Nitrosomonas sp.]HNB01963.1 patatin-like phospholipase family protein [Nitrosomonas sp.]